jgi:Glycosyltransferases involved in cell wall biogenesis
MRFSVVIPLYNKAPYVRKALRSVFDQTYRDFELIVVDDGSTDDSLAKAKESLDGSGIDHQLIHQDNAGVGTTRNNGVAASRGDFICFLDADDWWEPTFLERMDWLIREYPEAGIYGVNYFIISRGKQRVALNIPSTGYINYCDCYRKLQMPLTSISVAIPRDVFQRMGGFKPHLKLGEDFDLWIRIALARKVAYLDEPLAYYFQDSNPIWRGTGHLTEPKAHMLWNLGYLEPEEKTNPDYKRLIDELRIYGLLSYLLSDKYREAAKTELAKVDWKKQPVDVRVRYRLPVPILKFRRTLKKYGSRIKQRIIRHV